MAQEIERKFLVTSEQWRNSPCDLLRQGYLVQGEVTVRVRVSETRAWITVKGPATGACRDEFEYPIPLQDAGEMLSLLCRGPLIEKYRYRVLYKGLVWEVDEFLGENKGLIVAEVELLSQSQLVSLPPWVGREVTGLQRYYNSSLITKPYSQWSQTERQQAPESGA